MGPLLAAAAAAAARTRARRGAVSPASSSVTLLKCTIRVPPIIRASSTAARRARARSRILAAVSWRLSPASRHLGQEILEGSGACHAHRLARRSLYGVHANDGSAGMLKVPRIHGPLALQARL